MNGTRDDRQDRAGLELRVTVNRALDGYRLVGRRGSNRSIAGRAVAGAYVERCSDRIVRVEYGGGRALHIWREAVSIKTPHHLIEFQAKWGEVLKESILYDYARDAINDLAAIKAGLEIERRQFLKDMRGKEFFKGSFQIDPRSGSLFIQARSLLEFMRVELWMEFANGRPMQECQHCGSLFRTGGQRGKAKRADSKYCSASCRSMASRARRSA
jgi:hypothetical protein